MKFRRIPLLLILLETTSFSQVSLTENRKFQIIEALNSKPENWIEPLSQDSVELGTYEGRVVVNKKSKFTYFVHIQNPVNTNSPIVLIPMSTSRYTPTYYQTDEWWEKNKEQIKNAKIEGKPQPKQDMEEVRIWLEKMKFSTNPDVFLINPQSPPVYHTQPLQDYLLDLYLKNFVENGHVVLYRGAEKQGELESWRSRSVPKGVRYWTPTANYAWRYARKNTNFLNLLLKDEAPLFRFEIPVTEFKAMVQRRWPRLVLGTELTKNAHQIFDRSRYFGDHLYSGMPFLGWGSMGVELEVRSNRAGAQEMVRYFKGPVTIGELVTDRVRVLQLALKRLVQQQPSRASDFERQFQERIQVTLAEGEILKSLKTGEGIQELEAKVNALGSRPSEIGQIDGVYFKAWALEKKKQNIFLESKSCERLLK